MKKYKIIFITFAILLSLVLTSCNKDENSKPNIATLKGPTGMGMVKLMQDPSYDIALFENPDELVGKILNKEIDIACVPSNLASILYQKSNKNIQLIAVNTLGVISIVENGNSIKTFEDLNNKTLISTQKGSLPELILNHLCKKNNNININIQNQSNHSDVLTLLASSKANLGVLPEPFVTTLLSKNPNFHIAIDLNKEWIEKENHPLMMGSIIVNKEFAAKNPKILEKFILDYKNSVEFVNKKPELASKWIEKFKILPNANIAKKAIKPSNIVFITSNDAKDDLNYLYKVLYDLNPKTIGGSLPDEDFYYKN